MDMMDYLLVIRVSSDKTVILVNYSEQLYCQAIRILF